MTLVNMTPEEKAERHRLQKIEWQKRKRAEMGDDAFRREKRDLYAAAKNKKAKLVEQVVADNPDLGALKKGVMNSLVSLMTRADSIPAIQLMTPAVQERLLVKATEIQHSVAGSRNCAALLEQINLAVAREKEAHPTMKKLPTPNTLKQYHDTMHRTYKKYTGEKEMDCTNFKWLSDDLPKFNKWIDEGRNHWHHSPFTCLTSVSWKLPGYVYCVPEHSSFRNVCFHRIVFYGRNH